MCMYELPPVSPPFRSRSRSRSLAEQVSFYRLFNHTLVSNCLETCIRLLRFPHVQSGRIHTGLTGLNHCGNTYNKPWGGWRGGGGDKHIDSASSVLPCYLMKTPWGRDIAQSGLNGFLNDCWEFSLPHLMSSPWWAGPSKNVWHALLPGL